MSLNLPRAVHESHPFAIVQSVLEPSRCWELPLLPLPKAWGLLACLAPGHGGALKPAVPFLPICLFWLQKKSRAELFLSWAISRAISSHRSPASLGGPVLSSHKWGASFTVLAVPAWGAASQGDGVGQEHGPGAWSAMGKLLYPLSGVERAGPALLMVTARTALGMC